MSIGDSGIVTDVYGNTAAAIGSAAEQRQESIILLKQAIVKMDEHGIPTLNMVFNAATASDGHYANVLASYMVTGQRNQTFDAGYVFLFGPDETILPKLAFPDIGPGGSWLISEGYTRHHLIVQVCRNYTNDIEIDNFHEGKVYYRLQGGR